MLHDLLVDLRYSLLVEGLFRYNAHFIITLFSLGSHHERYNEVAVYTCPPWTAGTHRKTLTNRETVLQVSGIL